MNHIIMFKNTNKIHYIMYIYNHIYIYTHYSIYIYIYMLWHLKLQGNPKVTSQHSDDGVGMSRGDVAGGSLQLQPGEICQ